MTPTSNVSYGTTPLPAALNSTTAYNSPDFWESFYFEVVVLTISIVGVLSNSLVFYVMSFVDEDEDSRRTNNLIHNQTALDLFACVFLTVTYSTKLAKLNGTWSYWACLVIGSEMLPWIGLDGSAINLTFIAVELYVKMVYPGFHELYVSVWVIRGAIVFGWISGVVLTVPGIWTTTLVVDGHCIAGYYFPTHATKLANAIFSVVWQYLMPVLVFLACYWRILSAASGNTLRITAGEDRANKPDACHGGLATPEIVANSRMNVVKTMILVSVAFFLCWTANQVYFFLTSIPPLANTYYIGSDAWNGTLCVAFISVCANPFIYGARLEALKEGVDKFFCCGKERAKGSVTTISTCTTVL